MNALIPLVVHDAFLFPGGGERVALELARSFKAELWTGHCRPKVFPDGYFSSVHMRNLNALGKASLWLGFSEIARYAWAFSRMPGRKAAWTIFSGSLSLLAYRRISGPKLLYCHTPPRLLYDLNDYYLRRVHPVLRPGLRMVAFFYRRAYERALDEMDGIIANSANVKKRLKQYVHKDSEVIYPPCDTQGFAWLGQQDYYLSTARLDAVKRVDVVVNAFLKMPHRKLIVVSGGSEFNRIRALAGNTPHIQVLGWVEDALLKKLVGNCIATIYIPRDEDFGISPVESMSAGKPVIGVAEGGLLETVVSGETGILMNSKPIEEDVIAAVDFLTPSTADQMHSACVSQAANFSRMVFIEKIRKAVSRYQAI